MKNTCSLLKIASTFCALILLASCCFILVSCAPQALTNKEETQIKQDLLALMELDNDYRQTHNIAAPSIDEIELRFLGKFNGYTILHISSLYLGDNAYAQLGLDFEEERFNIGYTKWYDKYQMWHSISVAGKEDLNRDYAIWGYKDGTFYETEHLYIFGYIDFDQLMQIKNNFTHISTESRKATINYTEKLNDEILKTYVLKYEYVRGWEFEQRKPSIAYSYVSRLVAIIDNMTVVEISYDRVAPVEVTVKNPAGLYNSQQIGEYVFESDYTLQVYREGEIVDLDQAYALGWLTDCELNDLYNLIRLPYALQGR